jgi:hypothetical protein
MKNLSVIFLVLLASFYLSACSGSKPTAKQIPILVPVSETDKSATKNGVTVDVVAINESNVGIYPELSAKFSVLRSSIVGSIPTDVSEKNVLAGFTDPAAVTFSIKITNNTGHIIKLSGSDVGITVAGKDWRKLDMPKINSAWENYLNINYPEQPGIPAELLSAIKNIQIWDDNQKILPGKSITLYAPFDVKVGKGFSTATLGIYDVITNVDAAGNPTERTNMDFNFKEGSFTLNQY